MNKVFRFLFIVMWMGSLHAEDEVIQLADSVIIIQESVRKGILPALLEEHKPEDLEVLVQNFSPAELAFEAEVASCTLPVVVCFFEPKRYPLKELEWLQKCIESVKNEIKVVAVNQERLFTLGSHFRLDTFPTLLFFKEGKEMGCLEGAEITFKSIKKTLDSFLD